MACNSLNGVAKSCLSNIKGIAKIYLAALEDVDGLPTVVSGNVTDITMVASPVSYFYEYSFRKNTSSYTEAEVDPTTGFTGWDQTITLLLSRRQVSTRNEIAILAEGFRDLACIVLDNNGIYWYFGYSRGVNLTSTTGGSEDGIYTLTFVGQEPEQAYTVDSAAVLAVIEP